MGAAQVLHTHPESSTTSHHACSICLTAHAGLNTETAASTPVLATAALAAPAFEVAGIFRPAATRFIRPPPAA